LIKTSGQIANACFKSERALVAIPACSDADAGSKKRNYECRRINLKNKTKQSKETKQSKTEQIQNKNKQPKQKQTNQNKKQKQIKSQNKNTKQQKAQNKPGC
jgi:hypothetical protein